MNANFLKLARKNRESNPQSWEVLYENQIIRKIRGRKEDGGAELNLNQELALHRKEIQRLTEIIQKLVPDYEPSAEFVLRNGDIERCKAETREEMGIDK